MTAPDGGATPSGRSRPRAVAVPDERVLVLQRDRRLKWRSLDPLEALLMVLCGTSIVGFTVAVLCDVVTRTIGHPWLWLQQVTTGFFTYGVFIGMAAAARRNDHLYLTEITRRVSGSPRTALEVFGRAVVLLVALAMLWFGYWNFRLDLGSYRMPSMIPLGVYTIVVPISGALIALFAVEQIVNGYRRGFQDPEDG